jgi:secreted trypsin-like serine protease
MTRTIFAQGRFIWMYLILIMMCSASLEHSERELNARIIGGKVANPIRYSYYTFVEIKKKKAGSTKYEYSVCGGSLIAQDVVLTAAHCIDANKPIVSVSVKVNYTSDVDTTGYEYPRKVTKRIPYPNYNADTDVADLGILILDRPVNGVPMIKLNSVTSTPKVGQSLSVIGFGYIDNEETDPEYLMEVSVPTVSQQDCNDSNSYDGKIVQSAMICAGAPQGGKDSCNGDSGGPLFIRGKTANEDIQVGIVSFGDASGCAEPDYPGVYTRVSTYLKWIQETICQNSKFKPSTCTNVNPPTPTSNPKPTKKPTRKRTPYPTYPPTEEPSEAPVEPPVQNPVSTPVESPVSTPV